MPRPLPRGWDEGKVNMSRGEERHATRPTVNRLQYIETVCGPVGGPDMKTTIVCGRLAATTACWTRGLIFFFPAVCRLHQAASRCCQHVSCHWPCERSQLRWHRRCWLDDLGVPQLMLEAPAVIAAFSSVRRMTLNYICSIEVFWIVE